MDNVIFGWISFVIVYCLKIIFDVDYIVVLY